MIVWLVRHFLIGLTHWTEANLTSGLLLIGILRQFHSLPILRPTIKLKRDSQYLPLRDCHVSVCIVLLPGCAGFAFCSICEGT